MAENQYIYAVARVRSREQSLLTEAFFSQLVQAADYNACMRLLKEKGWGAETALDPEDMLAAQREKTWSFLKEIVGDTSIFNVFLYGNDYHNLKAAIKEAYTGKDFPDLYMKEGAVDYRVIRKAAAENDFQALPEGMRGCAAEAAKVLAHTGDGQLCDVIIDQGALTAIRQAGEASGDDFLKLYGELTAAAGDIRIAVRAARTGKDEAFLGRALADCRTLNKEELIRAAAKGEAAVADYLEKTEYREAAGELRKSVRAFEIWCDNLLMRRIRPQIHNPFGLGPLAAYILARENEGKMVRIILSGKRNGLGEDVIRERMRETYV